MGRCAEGFPAALLPASIPEMRKGTKNVNPGFHLVVEDKKML
jgi:hypothetical protein